MGHFNRPPQRQGADGSGYGYGDKPNIIWLMTDQHRHHAHGFAGDTNVHTPNLDQLANQGMYARRGGVSGNALCCPFRGSLLTSRWPHHCIPVHEAPLPDGMPTVAQPFNEAGYHTAWFGKWHVDGGRERDGRTAHWIVPPERRGGFQEWCGYENNNDQFDCWVHGGEGDDAFLEKVDGYETDGMTERFIDYLERRQSAAPDQPFFATLSVPPPHGPYKCPTEFRRLRSDEVALRPNVPPNSTAEDDARRILPGYSGMIENWDWNVGRIIDTLHQLDIAHNTHVIIFADHGDMIGSHGHLGKVVPHEESIRTPFIFAGTAGYGRCKGGKTDALINHVDIAPTSLGLAGIPVPDWMTGHDWSHLRTGAEPSTTPPKATLVQAIGPREQSPAYRAIVTEDGWKYAVSAEGPWLLHDLNDDPYELANRVHHPKFQDKRRELHQQLKQLVAEVGDEFDILNQFDG